MYNQLIQNFIQINSNLLESEKLWDPDNGVLFNGFPYENSFEEVVPGLYDLRDESHIFRRASGEDTVYSCKEAVDALQRALLILIEVSDNEKFAKVFDKQSQKCCVSFNFTNEKRIGNYIEAYTKWWLSAVSSFNKLKQKSYKSILMERKLKIEQIDRECDALLEKEYLDEIVSDIKYHLYKIAKEKENSNLPNHPDCKGYYVPEMSCGLGGKIADILTKELGTRVVGYNQGIDKFLKGNYFSGRYFHERSQYGVLFQMIDKSPEFEFSKEELLEMEAHQRIFG